MSPITAGEKALDVPSEVMSGSTSEFVDKLTLAMEKLDTRLHREDTLKKRVTRRFSKLELGDFLDLKTNAIEVFLNSEELAPEGVKIGRERTFSPDDIMLIRALMASKPHHLRRQQLFWRKPGDPLKIITFGAQKGGTGKSLSSAHFAQYLNLTYGLRVGVIDSDPQGTASLYFASDKTKLFDPETRTMADFMGIGEPDVTKPDPHSAEELNTIWQPTAWPGLRLMPAGANILNGDLALYLMSRQTPIYRVLKDAIDRWEQAYPPKTAPEDLRDKNGNFDQEAYENALHETVDVIVIDQQPSLTLMQLNGVVAADTLVIPQTVKGFDLSTLSTYVNSLREYFEFIISDDPTFEMGSGGHVVLPSIIQSANDRDIAQVVDLHRWAPGMVSEVWYPRSDAIANAAEEYMSIYEYSPPTNRRASAKSFMSNANAVNDHLVGRALSHLPSRGFAEAFINEHWS